MTGHFVEVNNRQSWRRPCLSGIVRTASTSLAGTAAVTCTDANGRLSAVHDADVVLGLVELHHAGDVVVTVHGAEVSLEVVLAVRRVAAVGTVEALLQPEHRSIYNRSVNRR